MRFTRREFSSGEAKYSLRFQAGGFAIVTRQSREGEPTKMRIPLDDLGVLAVHQTEAYYEALGLESLEVSPAELRVGDNVIGVGSILDIDRCIGVDGIQIIAKFAHCTEMYFFGRYNADGEAVFEAQLDITRNK